MTKPEPPEFNENLTAEQLMRGGITCPVCGETDKFIATLIETAIYRVKGEDWDQIEVGNCHGMIQLDCDECEFTLLKRTPREAIYIEDHHSRD